MLNRQMWETFKCLAKLTCFVWRFQSSRHKVSSKVIAEAASAEIRLLKPWVLPPPAKTDSFSSTQDSGLFPLVFPALHEWPSRWLTGSATPAQVVLGGECGCVSQTPALGRWPGRPRTGAGCGQTEEGRPRLGPATCPQKPRSHQVIFRFLKFISSLSQSSKLATSYFLCGGFLKLKVGCRPLGRRLEEGFSELCALASPCHSPHQPDEEIQPTGGVVVFPRKAHVSFFYFRVHIPLLLVTVVPPNFLKMWKPLIIKFIWRCCFFKRWGTTWILGSHVVL